MHFTKTTYDRLAKIEPQLVNQFELLWPLCCCPNKMVINHDLMKFKQCQYQLYINPKSEKLIWILDHIFFVKI